MISKENEFCDNCSVEISPSQRYAFGSLPRNVTSANKGESAVLCEICYIDLLSQIYGPGNIPDNIMENFD